MEPSLEAEVCPLSFIIVHNSIVIRAFTMDLYDGLREQVKGAYRHKS
jgi:hypothetical protein